MRFIKQYNRQFFSLHFVWAVLSVVAVFSTAAQVRFYSSVNTNSVALNDVIQFDIVVENGSIEKLQQPTLNGFNVVSGPNISQGFEVVNGKYSSRTAYSFLLQPIKKGTLIIPKIKAKVEGVNVESQTITINVTTARQSGNSSQPNNNPTTNNTYEEEAEDEIDEDNAAAYIEKHVLLLLESDKKSGYVGEQINAQLKLLFNVDVEQFRLTKTPDFENCWSKAFGNDEKERTIVVYQGKKYYSVNIMRYTIFPKQAGKITVSPATADIIAAVQMNTGDWLYDNLLGGNEIGIPQTIISNKLVLNITALPEVGKPENFSGAVGDFHYNIAISGKEGKTDEKLNVVAQLSGTGNWDNFSMPQPVFDSTFEVYPAINTAQLNESEDGFSGYKNQEYVLVPTMPGNYRFTPPAFNFFNPATAKYEIVQSPEISFSISGSPVQRSRLMDSSGLSATGQPLRFQGIHTGFSTTDATPALAATAGYYALAVTPFLLLMGAWFVRKRINPDETDSIAVKQRTAKKIAVKRLQAAHKFMQQNNKEAFYQEIAKGIWGYLANKLTIDPALLSKENATEILLQKSVDEPTIQRLLAVIEHSEMALYAPSVYQEKMQEDYHQAVQLIVDLEQKIKTV